MMKLKMPFRRKMIVSFFIVISLTALIMSYSYYHIMRGELEISALQSMEKVSGQTVDTLNLYMKTIENIGYSYFSNTSLQKFMDGPPSFEDQQYYRDKLEVQRRQNPLMSTITIVRLNGEQLSSFYYYKSDLRELLNQEYSRVGLMAGKLEGVPLWTSSITTTDSSLNPVKTISYVQQLKRITVNAQHAVGYMKIDLDPDVLRSTFQGLQTNNGGTYYVVDARGSVLFAEDNKTIGKSLKGDPVFTQYLGAAKRNKGTNYRFEENGQIYAGIYHKLSYGGWIVLGSAPLDGILQKVNTFRNTVILIGMISFLAAMLLASVIAAGVTRPLKELNKKMKQVEIGDFKAEIAVKGDDEFSTIQRSFNKMTSEIRSLISRVYETELLKKEAEIKALQSQINPHFLYNTLGTIDSISAINGEKRISFICQALGNLLRYNLDGGSYATMKEEVFHLEQYLSIYQLRFGGQFRYEIHLERSAEMFVLPKLLLQPLIENAVVHGLENKIGDKMLQLTVRHYSEHTLEIVVEDNGVGIEPGTANDLQQRTPGKLGTAQGRFSLPHTRIGLSNVVRRLEMYDGFDPEFHLESSPGKGTRITFLLPKQEARRDHA